jgi:FSR family fosmidomycin resistance protein-like MFS transporter
MTLDPAPRSTTLFLNVGHAYAHLIMMLFPTVVLALEGAWGMSYAELLPLGFAGYLLFGLGSLPAGWLGDRWHGGRMMVVFFLGTGGACLLTGLAAGPWSLAVGLSLIGLFASIYHPIAISWLVGAGDRPGRTLGINGVWGAAGLGSAGLVAGGLAELVHWRAAFLVPGAFCLVTGLVFAAGLARGRLSMVRGSYRGRADDTDGSAALRGLLLMLAAIVFTGLIFQIASVGLPKIFQVRLGDTIGAGALAAGTLVSVVYGVSALGQVAGGMIADRWDERWVYPLSYATQVAALLLASLSPDLWLVPLVAFAIALQTGTGPVENCLLARYTPESRRATIYGLKFVLALGLSSLGVPLVAIVYGYTGGVDGVFWILITLSLIVIAIGMMLPRSRAALVPAGARALRT